MGAAFSAFRARVARLRTRMSEAGQHKTHGNERQGGGAPEAAGSDGRAGGATPACPLRADAATVATERQEVAVAACDQTSAPSCGSGSVGEATDTSGSGGSRSSRGDALVAAGSSRGSRSSGPVGVPCKVPQQSWAEASGKGNTQGPLAAAREDDSAGGSFVDVDLHSASAGVEHATTSPPSHDAADAVAGSPPTCPANDTDADAKADALAGFIYSQFGIAKAPISLLRANGVAVAFRAETLISRVGHLDGCPDEPERSAESGKLNATHRTSSGAAVTIPLPAVRKTTVGALPDWALTALLNKPRSAAEHQLQLRSLALLTCLVRELAGYTLVRTQLAAVHGEREAEAVFAPLLHWGVEAVAGRPGYYRIVMYTALAKHGSVRCCCEGQWAAYRAGGAHASLARLAHVLRGAARLVGLLRSAGVVLTDLKFDNMVVSERCDGKLDVQLIDLDGVAMLPLQHVWATYGGASCGATPEAAWAALQLTALPLPLDVHMRTTALMAPEQWGTSAEGPQVYLSTLLFLFGSSLDALVEWMRDGLDEEGALDLTARRFCSSLWDAAAGCMHSKLQDRSSPAQLMAALEAIC